MLRPAFSNTNSNALRNQFSGSNDGSVSDANQWPAAWPNQNVYMLGGAFNNHNSWSMLALDQVVIGAVGATPSWHGQQDNLTLGTNYTGGNGEADYFASTYTGANSYAHAFYGANSSNNAWTLLGGFRQNGALTIGSESGAATYLACYTTSGTLGHCTTSPSGSPPTCGCTSP